MNFKSQVVTAAHRAACVESLEEVVAHGYESEECSECFHQLTLCSMQSSRVVITIREL